MLHVLNTPKCLYICISVALAHYAQIKNFIENWCRNGIQNLIKEVKFETRCKPKSENGDCEWEIEVGNDKMEAARHKIVYRREKLGPETRQPDYGGASSGRKPVPGEALNAKPGPPRAQIY